MKLNYIGFSYTTAVVCFLLSSTGYVSAQKVKKDTVAKNKQIEEVVVTALGIKRDQRKLGYAITKVETKDITQAGIVNPMEALQGKLPGVEISSGTGGPQSSARIQIRGNTSLGNNNQPLIVVDGVFIDNGVTGADSWGSGYDFGNEMKNLNSDIFESVTVLRGAAASALYGSRAANGVIVITTKKGKAKNGIGVRINSSLTTQHVYSGPKFQNEFGGGRGLTFDTNANGERFIDPQFYQFSYGPRFDGKPVRDVDGRTISWDPKPNNYKDIYQVGTDRRNSFEISGGDSKSTFFLSYSNLEAEGIMPRNKFTKNAYAFRATHEFSKYLQIDAGFNYNRSFGQNPAPQGGNDSQLMGYVLGLPRNFDTTYWRNNYLDPEKGGTKKGSANPYEIADDYLNFFKNTRTQKENNYIGRLELKSQITDWLQLILGGNFNNYSSLNESKIFGTGDKFSGGSYTITEGTKEQSLIKFLLNGNFKLTDNLTLNASFGGEEFRSKYRGTSQSTNGLNVPGIFELFNSVDAPTIRTYISDGGQSPKRMQSLYAFANFAWKDQLFIDITGRNDWSSTLAYPSGYGSLSYFYPSFVGNWAFSKSFSLPQWINFGSLRASLAWVGRDTSPFNTSSGLYYSSDGTAYIAPDGSRIPLINFNSRALANRNLKNELSKSIEFGLNMAFFNNRLDFDVSFYKTNTTNQLLTLTLPQESGVSQRQINAGNLQNQGIEVIANAVPFKSNNFQWNTTITFSKNKDKIIDLYPGVNSYLLNYGMGSDVMSIAIPGNEYGLIQTNYAYARYHNNENSNDPKNGMKVLNANGYYLRSNSYQDQGNTTVGKTTPDFLTSFRNTFKYKNLALSVLIDARVGGNILSTVYNYGIFTGVLPSTLKYRDEATGGIKYTDTNGKTQYGMIPDGVFAQGIKIKDKQGVEREIGGMTYKEVYDNGWMNPVRTDLYYRNLSSWPTGIREQAIFENTWVAFREARLTYFFNPQMIKPLGLNTLNMSLIGRNLFYLYNKLPDGINPEGRYSNSAGSFAEYGGSPMSRYIGFNLDFSF